MMFKVSKYVQIHGNFANINCPNVYDEYFIRGTAPNTECSLHTSSYKGTNQNTNTLNLNTSNISSNSISTENTSNSTNSIIKNNTANSNITSSSSNTNIQNNSNTQ